MATPSAPLARLAAVSALLHFGFDSVTRPFTLTAPPYLQLQYMHEIFRDMIDLMGVGPVSAVTSAVNGLVAAVFAVALAEVTTRRATKLGALLFGIWLVTGAGMYSIYLSAPWSVAIGSLAAGLPRAAVLAFFLDRMTPRPEPTQGPPT
jgi:hypothetical protein